MTKHNSVTSFNEIFWFRPHHYPGLRKLFNDGITPAQLVQAGCRKCDDIFLSQIPAHQSITSSQPNKHIFEIMSNQDFTTPEGKSDVVFKLSLSEEFRDLREKFKGSEYIEWA
ncbi:hypothetical protein GLOIN_2v1781828 [Rhizophagus irregularis DAOM 181602=DAOM 197198]|uniref:Uncharacterized protein n=1 Tax=Rhizophagus irregularis (strain DAOM 181602 / DAOM 197198 / MUCL 43194) TaxID=747089 RepID=U9UJQ7_RHIID|nr:hypothetical protein GLOIN_2v1781828 [Rhizophagus irregularis DAOM 181602=DAOM 197198]